MGTYVFQRLQDMFEFFRTDRQDGKLRINLGYWTEKLVAIDGNRYGGKAKEFCQDKFKRIINRYRIDWMREAKERGSLDKDGRRELWEAVNYDVLDHVEDGGERAMIAAHDFRHVVDRKSWEFTDIWEHDFTDYTHRLVWCCYALAWGIQQYDNSKIQEAA
jgi:hypothetical protein